MEIYINKGDKVELIYLGRHYKLGITEFGDLELRWQKPYKSSAGI